MKKIFGSFSFLICFFFLISATYAQTPATASSADIYLQLKKLNVLGSVLYVGAHPDDENTRLLAYLAKGKLLQTGYLSLTRGDGGQNLIGDEQGVELGLIRTQELLAARRIDGAEQFFSRAYDFGFSKSSEETMRIWDKDKILSDVVWVIRKFQPDVIITRFPEDARAGHGHHSASAILAREAFVAAADSTKFTEHFGLSVRPWKARRILWNTFNFGGNNTTSNEQFKVDVGSYNPLLGKGYGEIASESRSQHKSQGFGVARQRGQSFEFFQTIGGDAPANDLMDGIYTSWDRVGVKNVTDTIQLIIDKFSFEKPELSVPALVRLHKSINRMPAGYWRTKKLNEINNLVQACSGLFLEAATQQEYGVQGDSLKINLVANNRNGVNATLKTISVLSEDQLMREERGVVQYARTTGRGFPGKEHKEPLMDSSVNKKLAPNQNTVIPVSWRLPDNAPISQPYWLTNGIKHGYFDINDQVLIGKAESKPAFTARYILEIEGEEFLIESPVQYKHTDPVKGELYQPLTIIPKVITSISPSVVLSNVKPPAVPMINFYYNSNINAKQVPATLALANGGTTNVFTNKPVDLTPGVTASYSVPISKVYHAGQQRHIESSFALQLNNRQETFSQYLRTIKYDHIPSIHYFYKDHVTVIDEEIKTVGKKIGYIPGAGDKVAEALQTMGYAVTILNEESLTNNNLQQFDAIITGVRAYNVHEYLSNKYNVLMNYIKQGGNLIVQYNTNSQIGPVRARISPYPFTIGRGRVTNETANVNVVHPTHPVFNFPNKITAKDFQGWVQERSIYQAEQLDSNFVTPVSMSDVAEKESSGSLAIAKYGKGNFTYVSLVLFRQLPAAVPGAYRLLANLIALPKNK